MWRALYRTAIGAGLISGAAFATSVSGCADSSADAGGELSDEGSAEGATIPVVDGGGAPADAPTDVGSGDAPPSDATTGGSHAIKTVFVVMVENMQWSNILGNTGKSPYVN